jgi:PAS domain S-box-containing protein
MLSRLRHRICCGPRDVAEVVSVVAANVLVGVIINRFIVTFTPEVILLSSFWAATVALLITTLQMKTAAMRVQHQLMYWSKATNDLMAIAPLCFHRHEIVFSWVNEAWTRQTGWDQEELLQMSVEDIIEPEDLESLAWIDAVTGLNCGTGNRGSIRCKDGRGRIFEWRYVKNGEFILVCGTDITDAMQMAAELSRFASITAHQLKGPARTASALATSVLEDYGHTVPEPAKDRLKLISERSQSLAETVVAISMLTGLRNKNVETYPVNIMPLILGAAKKAKEARAGMVYLPSHDKLMVMGDTVLLGEVFYNLIENGLKFNQAKVPCVSVEVEPDDLMVSIKFVDNGVGIAPEYRAQLFAMFYRAHSEFPGTGVGLALAQAILSKLDGSIRYIPLPMGSAFVVSLRPSI